MVMHISCMCTRWGFFIKNNCVNFIIKRGKNMKEKPNGQSIFQRWMLDNKVVSAMLMILLFLIITATT